MKHRKLGQKGPDVSALGLGCMSLGIAEKYTSSIQSDDDAVELIHHALELGVTFLDTADVYGDSEDKIGKAIRGKRERVFLATKFGFARGGGRQGRPVDGSPKYVHEACESSLKRLGVDHVDLYQLHRVDDTVPIEDTVGAMAELVRAGKVKHIGLSEPSAATVRRAGAVADSPARACARRARGCGGCRAARPLGRRPRVPSRGPGPLLSRAVARGSLRVAGRFISVPNLESGRGSRNRSHGPRGDRQH